MNPDQKFFSFLAGMLFIGLATAGCTDADSPEESTADIAFAEETDGRSGTGVTPPTIVALDLIYPGIEDPVELPQLIGLSEKDAIQWAMESGFETVHNTRDPGGPEVLAVGTRIYLTTDADGFVIKATSE